LQCVRASVQYLDVTLIQSINKNCSDSLSDRLAAVPMNADKLIVMRDLAEL